MAEEKKFKIAEMDDPPKFNEEKMIPCPPLADEDIPDGSYFVPVIVKGEDGTEKEAYVLMTPELLAASEDEDDDRIDKEMSRMMDVIIDRGVEQAKAKKILTEDKKDD